MASGYDEVERIGRKSANRRPLVTVFGGGVSGLSAAHELIERGFEVQLVEPKPSEDCEYECEVGGMAANQFGRVKHTKRSIPTSSPMSSSTTWRRPKTEKSSRTKKPSNRAATRSRPRS